MICRQTAKQFCKDDISKIENYEIAIKDETQVWHCHHRLELHPDGSPRFTAESLKKLDLYFNRPSSELIFLTPKEHSDLHKIGKPHPHKGGFQSEQKRQNLSKAKRGVEINKTPPTLFGKMYKEHYNLKQKENVKLYYKELYYFKTHGKCSWQ